MNSIFHRVSIRKYKSQPVGPDKIEQINLLLQEDRFDVNRVHYIV